MFQLRFGVEISFIALIFDHLFMDEDHASMLPLFNISTARDIVDHEVLALSVDLSRVDGTALQ